MRNTAPHLTNSSYYLLIALIGYTSIFVFESKNGNALISVAAWPSSVRALRCLVKSLNGRNLYRLFVYDGIYHVRW